MSDLITLRGFVGSDPDQHIFPDGTAAARFRMATTTRRFDAEKNTWVDVNTNWYSVRCYRALALHVKASVTCGQPVIVTGKIQQVEWNSENGPRTIVQVDAYSVGHDLNFGTAAFTRPNGKNHRPNVATDSPQTEAPEDNHFVSVDEAGPNEVMDAVTGTLVSTHPGDTTFSGLDTAMSYEELGHESESKFTDQETDLEEKELQLATY